MPYIYICVPFNSYITNVLLKGTRPKRDLKGTLFVTNKMYIGKNTPKEIKEPLYRLYF